MARNTHSCFQYIIEVWSEIYPFECLVCGRKFTKKETELPR